MLQQLAGGSKSFEADVMRPALERLLGRLAAAPGSRPVTVAAAG
jgi:hypothetical protein